MKLPRYQFESDDILTTFEFISDGHKGLITKIVQYGATNLKDVYNLGFGDKNPVTGEVDDKIVSNNGDGEKVLATVVATIYAFTHKNPDALIYISGSTKSRTRLYRMGITKYFSEIKDDFELNGQINSEWELFRNGINYDAFLIERKK